MCTFNFLNGRFDVFMDAVRNVPIRVCLDRLCIERLDHAVSMLPRRVSGHVLFLKMSGMYAPTRAPARRGRASCLF